MTRSAAADVYSATFMGLFKPLPDSQCRMDPGIRAAFEFLDADTAAAFDPLLHPASRHDVRTKHLELPLSL